MYDFFFSSLHAEQRLSGSIQPEGSVAGRKMVPGPPTQRHETMLFAR